MAKLAPRMADALLAVQYLFWRWVEGFGPASNGFDDSEWLLPEGKTIDQVKSNEWELLDVNGRGKYTVKSLPAVTTDISATWLLVEQIERMELRKDGQWWVCRIGDVECGAETAQLAISRAAYKAKTQG